MFERLVAGGDASTVSLVEVCQVCTEVVASSGAALSLRTAGEPEGPLNTSDPLARAMEELQFVLGEGPSVDAHSSGRLVLVAQLGEAAGRWPEFAPAAVAGGLGAVFAFPLQLGAVKVGVLSLYREEAGPLTVDEVAEGLVLSEAVTHLVLAIQAEAPVGSLARPIADLAQYRAVIHQATGMIAAQLEVGVDEALIRLRAYTYTQDDSITRVAKSVVSRELRCER